MEAPAVQGLPAVPLDMHAAGDQCARLNLGAACSATVEAPALSLRQPHRMRRIALPEASQRSRMTPQRLRIALAVAAACAISPQPSSSAGGNASFDPLLDDSATCAPGVAGPPALFRRLILAAAETAPFQPVPAKPALAETPVLYRQPGRR